MNDCKIYPARVYQDSEGRDLTIRQMVKREPEWAASRIQAGENALDVLAKIKEWDIANYLEHGSFALPQELRDWIQKVGA